MNHTPGKLTIADPAIYTQTRHRDQRFKRVACLLVCIAREQGRRVVQGLSPEERSALSAEIRSMGRLTPAEVRGVCSEFAYSPAGSVPEPAGGEATVRELGLE